ncbi:MAG: hypothetical protein ACXADF_08840 [Candidatus Thorarchaeota archaeon]
MKRRNSMRVSAILAIALIMLMTLDASATVVWSDDFNDGNYNGWTIERGGFSASNGYLECTVSGTGKVAKIVHDSTVGAGTWSFDFFYVIPGAIWVLFWGDDTSIATGTIFNIQIYDDLVLLNKNNQELGAWSYGSPLTVGWTHVEVTMDDSFNIDVYVNGTHRIHSATLDPLVTCLYFVVAMNQIGQAVDNIVVSEQEATETTTTPTTISTPTTTPTIPSMPPVPMEMIALVGGAAVVVIVLVIFMKRR